MISSLKLELLNIQEKYSKRKQNRQSQKSQALFSSRKPSQQLSPPHTSELNHQVQGTLIPPVTPNSDEQSLIPSREGIHSSRTVLSQKQQQYLQPPPPDVLDSSMNSPTGTLRPASPSSNKYFSREPFQFDEDLDDMPMQGTFSGGGTGPLSLTQPKLVENLPRNSGHLSTRLQNTVEFLKEQNLQIRCSSGSGVFSPSRLISPRITGASHCGDVLSEMQVQQMKAQEGQIYAKQENEKLFRRVRRLEEDNRTNQERIKELLSLQQELENDLENYEAKNKKQSDDIGTLNRKICDMQRRISEREKELREANERCARVESEKQKLSEKWVRVSGRLKNEEKSKQKQKEMEEGLERVRKEASRFSELYDRCHREVMQLRGTVESQKSTIGRMSEELKHLRSEKHQEVEEKEMVDKVTNELLVRIKNYEKELELLRQENRELVRIKQESREREELVKQAEQSEMKAEELLRLNQQLIQKLEIQEREHKHLTELVASLEAHTAEASNNFRAMQSFVESVKSNFQEAFDSIQFSEKSLTALQFSDRTVAQSLKLVVDQLNKKENVLGSAVDPFLSLSDLSSLKDNKTFSIFLVRCAEKLFRLQEDLALEQKRSQEAEAKFDRMVRRCKQLQDDAHFASFSSKLLNESLRAQQLRLSQARLSQQLKSFSSQTIPRPGSRCSSVQRHDESALTNISCITSSQPVIAGVVGKETQGTNYLKRVNSLNNLTPSSTRSNKATPLLSARGNSPPKRTLLLPPHSPCSERRGCSILSNKASFQNQGIAPFKGNHLLSSFENETPHASITARGALLPPPRSSSRARANQGRTQFTATPKRTSMIETPPSRRKGSASKRSSSRKGGREGGWKQ